MLQQGDMKMFTEPKLFEEYKKVCAFPVIITRRGNKLIFKV